jgi:hypothetical protein
MELALEFALELALILELRPFKWALLAWPLK